MPEIPFVHDLVTLFGAAVLVILVSNRLRIPPVVGFLLTGIFVGPSGLGIVDHVENVEILAELGVVFLLFIVGLEFSTERLRRLARLLLVGGGLQVGVSIGVATALAASMGYTVSKSVYLGFLLALSSTAVVLKLYSDRRELDSPHGQVSIGILLFQDFLIVPMLLVVPLLAGTSVASAGEIATRFGGGLLVVGAVFAAGRYLVPRFLDMVVRTRVRELYVIGALFAALGAGVITESLGFSLALGAFLAGILIAESEYHHQVLADTAPFRDVFNSIFFISMGMLLDLPVLFERPGQILLLALGVIVLKASAAGAAVRVLGFPTRTAIIAGLGLAQIGEFSFVLIRSGFASGLLETTEYQIALAVAVLTLMATAGLIGFAPQLADRATGAGASTVPALADNNLEQHVVIGGYGLNGRHLARVLRSAGIRYVIVDLNPASVRKATAAGEPIIFGDCTRRDILEGAKIDAARVVVFALSDAVATRAAVTLARSINTELFIAARARQLSEIENLQDCGADVVIAEEFETSIEIVTRVLQRLHVPGNIIRTEARILRADGYQMLRTQSSKLGMSDRVMQALTEGTTDTFLLDSKHAAVGSSVRDLDLRRRSGATVIAVIRAGHSHTNPPPDMSLAEGDILVLVGSHAQIDSAFSLLGEGRSGNTVEEPIPTEG